MLFINKLSNTYNANTACSTATTGRKDLKTALTAPEVHEGGWLLQIARILDFLALLAADAWKGLP